MSKQKKNVELYHVKFEKDERCIDMLLTMKEIERGSARATSTENLNLLEGCSTCWPIEKPPKSKFWDSILFKWIQTKK